MRALASAIVATTLLTSAAQAEEPLAGPVKATFVSCYDGDTCRFNVVLWPGITAHTAVRVRGIDTPEIAGKCGSEKSAAAEARDFIVTRLSAAQLVQLTDIEPDKYAGRVIANIMLDGQSAAEMMISSGYAREYDGGSRDSWCDRVAGSISSPRRPSAARSG